MQNTRLEDTLPFQLAVGLPPAHYDAQNRAFTEYLSGRGPLRFGFHGTSFAVCIDDVRCYPQAYAAAVPLLAELMQYPAC